MARSRHWGERLKSLCCPRLTRAHRFGGGRLRAWSAARSRHAEPVLDVRHKPDAIAGDAFWCWRSRACCCAQRRSLIGTGTRTLDVRATRLASAGGWRRSSRSGRARARRCSARGECLAAVASRNAAGRIPGNRQAARDPAACRRTSQLAGPAAGPLVLASAAISPDGAAPAPPARAGHSLAFAGPGLRRCAASPSALTRPPHLASALPAPARGTAVPGLAGRHARRDLTTPRQLRRHIGSR